MTDLVPDIVRKLPRYPVVQTALLGRLAVAQRYQGKGRGEVLPGDAVLCTARVELGVFALIVDAEDEAAELLYEHYGSTLFPEAERRLCLPIAMALQHVEGRTENSA